MKISEIFKTLLLLLIFSILTLLLLYLVIYLPKKQKEEFLKIVRISESITNIVYSSITNSTNLQIFMEDFKDLARTNKRILATIKGEGIEPEEYIYKFSMFLMASIVCYGEKGLGNIRLDSEVKLRGLIDRIDKMETQELEAMGYSISDKELEQRKKVVKGWLIEIYNLRKNVPKQYLDIVYGNQEIAEKFVKLYKRYFPKLIIYNLN